MTTFPSKLATRAAATIAKTYDLVQNAHQRINTLGSQVSSLSPGSWELVSLSAGWSNTAGYIPAQVRILQAGMSQIVGHIQGGTVTDGTVIGTLTAGYFNAVHAHTFTVNSVAGAAASSQAGNLTNTSGNLNSGSGSLNDPTGNLNSGSGTLTDLAGDLNSGSATLNDLAGDLNNGTVSGTAFGSLHVATGLTLHAGGVSVPTGLTLHSGNVSVPTGLTLNSGNVSVPTALTLTSGATTTNVNKNSPTITLNTSGQLVIANVDPNVTQLSFSQILPLVTS